MSDKPHIRLNLKGGNRSMTEAEMREAIGHLWEAVKAVDPSVDVGEPDIATRWQCDVCGVLTLDKEGWTWDDRGDVCPSCQGSG